MKTKIHNIESWDCQIINYDYMWPNEAITPLGKKADLIFADPPYNIGVQYADDVTKDKMSAEEYRDFTMICISAAISVARPGATLWWMVPEEHADWVGEMLTAMVGPRLYRIVWEETFSQYQGNRALTKDYRFIFVHRVTTGEGEVTWNPDEIRIPSARQLIYRDKRANGKGRVPGTTWKFTDQSTPEEMAAEVLRSLEGGVLPHEQKSIIADALRHAARMPQVPGDVWRFRRLQGTSTDRVDWHPAQLPPELLVRIVKGWTNPGDLVFDAFAGSGSLAKVCRSLGRSFVGVDQSPTYVDKLVEELS